MKKHKKKRESKKHLSKKRSKIKKKVNIWIFLIVGLITLLFLSNFPKEKTDEKTEIIQKKAVIENLTFNEIPDSSRSWLSFYLRNDYDEYADCSAILFLNNDSFSWNAGIIKPSSRKLVKKSVFMPNGNTSIKLISNCEWSQIDISECENSTFKICDLFKEDKSIAQCLNRNIPMQYFCIALIKNDVSYCDDIKLLPRDRKSVV